MSEKGKYDSNTGDILDFPSLRTITFEECAMSGCHIAVFESM